MRADEIVVKRVEDCWYSCIERTRKCWTIWVIRVIVPNEI